MDIFSQILSMYAPRIIEMIFIVVAGIIAVAIKRIYQKYIEGKIKKETIRECVAAIEQIYKTLHGEDKLNRCIAAAAEWLTSKKIKFTEEELRILIESAVHEMNQILSDPVSDDNQETGD